MEFEKLNLSLKRSRIKKLNEKQKEIYKDILRIGRSITHHRRMVSQMKEVSNLYTPVFNYLKGKTEHLGKTTCDLCCKYNNIELMACVPCPLVNTRPQYKCTRYNSPYAELSDADDNNDVSEFIKIELNKMLPALYHTLENYKGLLNAAK
jgi:hypothetical protein